MRRIYSLAVLLVMLLASTTVKAQDADFMESVTVGYWDSNGYTAVGVTFPLEDVAAKLGITKEQLVTELEYSYPADEERGDWPASTIPFSSKMQDGTIYTGNYTADGCGYWMDANGDPCGYDGEGATCKIFDRLTWDGDYIMILIGRHPNLSADGGTFTFFPTLTYGEKTVVFKIDYTYEARPVIENETTLSKLTLTSGVTIELTQKKRSNYNADNIHVAVPTLLADLGFASQSELVMAEALYAQVYQYDGVSDMYQWADSITNERTTTGIGFWFGKTYEYPDLDAETIENRTNLGRHEHGVECLFYAENVEFFRSEGADSLSLNIGQYPDGASDDGEEYHATMYVVNGSIAYPINIVLTIEKTDHTTDPNLGLYEKAGEIEVVLEGEYDSSYQTIHAPIDAEAIAIAMGAESPQDLQLWVRTMDGGDELRRYNDGAPSGDISWVDDGIMWINNVGVVVGWSSAAATMISYQMLSDGTYTIGGMDMPGGQFADETPYTMSVYLCYPSTAKYYEVIVTRQVSSEPLPDKKPMDQWVLTKAFTVNASVIPAPHEDADSGDHNAGTVTISMEDILLALGVDNVKNVRLYGQRPIEGEEVPYADGESLTFTNSYTCTPYPGFWMGDGGKYPTNYSNSDSYGMTLTYNTGVITIWNIPNARNVGDNFSSVFYLVDDVVGKYVKLNFNVKFVSSLVPIEVAGEQEVVVAWNPDDGGISLCYPDLEEAVNTLLDGDDSLVGSCKWYVEIDNEYQLKPDFGTDSEGCLFDADGKFICQLSDGDVYDEAYNTAAFGLGFDYVDFSFGVSSLNNLDTWVVSGVVKVNVAMEYEGKRWIFHCLVGDKETIETGISDIIVNANGKKEVFDLTGRRVAAPAKGLYIINGKKVMVK